MLPRLAIVIAALILGACDRRPAVWTAWVYPDASDLTQSLTLANFKTFEQCQEAAIGHLRSLPDPDAGYYECGYRCEWKPEWNTNVCKTTRK